MRHIVSTAIVAITVSLATVTTMGALAQEPRPIAPAAVSKINADRVDGRHAVGAGASVAKRAGKLVATNAQGYLPPNILKDRPVTGIRLTQVIGTAANVPASSYGAATVTCPAGSKVTGGGFYSGSLIDFSLASSRPHSSALNGWAVDGWNTSTITSLSLTAYATCMTVTPEAALTTASKGSQPAKVRSR